MPRLELLLEWFTETLVCLKNLGISRKGAKAYIDTYLNASPGIKNYMGRSGACA